MLIDQAAIARLIPHTGAMCLLDGVLSWDATRIACVSTTHLREENPLRRDGRIGILCGVEYAAQAMALHAVLAGGVGEVLAGGAGEALAGGVGEAAPRGGYLASLRAVCCHGDRLDANAGELRVEAERLFGEAERAIYGFAVGHQRGRLLSGRAGVVLEPRGG